MHARCPCSEEIALSADRGGRKDQIRLKGDKSKLEGEQRFQNRWESPARKA